MVGYNLMYFNLIFFLASWFGIAVGRFVDKKKCDSHLFKKLLKSASVILLLGGGVFASDFVYDKCFWKAFPTAYWGLSFLITLGVPVYFHYNREALDAYLTDNTYIALHLVPRDSFITVFIFPFMFFFM